MIPENFTSDAKDNSSKTELVKKRNLWVAGLLNWVAPGLGYYYCGKFILGIIVILLFPFIYILADFVSILLPSKLNVLFYFITHFLFALIFLIHGILIAKKNKQYVLKPQNNIYIYLIILLFSLFYTTSLYSTNFESFKTETNFMQNTIIKDEEILIRLNSYSINNPLNGNKLFYISQPKRYDVVLYTTQILDSNGKTISVPILNRVMGVPGDTIRIVNRICYTNGQKEKQKETYLYNGVILDTSYHSKAMYPTGSGWNKDQYGPLYIPKAGDIIKLDSANMFIWEEIISLENHLTVDNAENYFSKILSERQYLFKKNYYFLMGDNRNHSTDSRISGLFSEEEIKGKAEFIIGSFTDINLFSPQSRAGIKIE